MAEKILIVDDDVNALKLIGYTLHREGYEIIAAQSGQEALVKLSLFTPAPELFAQAAVEGVPVVWTQQASLQADMFRELAQRIA